MDNIERSEKRGGIAGLIIAALLGYLTPFASALLIGMQLPVVALSAVAIAWVTAKKRRSGLLVCGLAAALSAGMNFGWVYAIVALLAGVLPAASAARDMDRHLPFSEQMQKSIAMHIMGTVGAVAALYLNIGGDIVGYYGELFRVGMESLNETYFEAMAPAFGMMLGEEMDAAGVRELMNLAMQDAEIIFTYLLPGMLVSGSVVTAVLTVSLGNRARAGMGRATVESYLPASRWVLPYRMGTALFVLLTLVILFTDEGGTGEVAFYTVYYLAATAYLIRLIAWTQEVFTRKRLAKWIMCLIYVVAWLLATALGLFPALVTCGGMIAVFGRNGDVHRYLARRLRKMGHDIPGDPEEFLRRMKEKQQGGQEDEPDEADEDEDNDDDELK